MAMSVRPLWPLGLGLIVSIVCDLRGRRIPNAASAWILVSGLTLRGFEQGAAALFSGVGAAALVVAALYRPWLRGGIGGGDVKLAAAAAAWVPFARLHWFALCAAVAGGLVAGACYLLARPPARAEIRANLTLTVLHNELPAMPSHRAGQLSVPYALAIAAGAAIALLAPL
ncbi:MAG TPA: A24 family peptidase [Polyangia bacterium]|nr:A24 family peptidase [Polyangia bacterium]